MNGRRVLRAWVWAGGLALGIAAGASAEELRDPPVFEPEGGVTKGRLEAGLQDVEIGGRTIYSTVYGGLYAPPTIRVPPGGVIELELANRLEAIGQPTNIHFHGMNVSPIGDSDNIFRQVEPGQTAKYRIQLPEDHPQGMYWYHTHANYYAEWQVFGGLSGAIVVEGLLDPLPELKGIADRVMILKNIRTSFNGTVPNDIVTSDPSIHTINGQKNPTIRIAPGETQLWRLGNVGANQYYRLKLEGHRMWEIARDGNRRRRLVPKSEIIIPPSARIEVLVQGGKPGTHILRMKSARTGPQGDQYKSASRRFSLENFGPRDEPMATVIVEGSSQTPVDLASIRMPEVEDLREQPVAEDRTIVFSETADGNTFFINGNYFDINRVDTTARFGTIEEWTLRNVSDELHVFHIHQLDFQVTSINGVEQEFLGHQDTVSVPNGGSVKILIPFTNPVVIGKFVYHCHIMEHEDKGMMAVIEVVDEDRLARATELASNGGLFGPDDLCVYGAQELAP